MTSIERRAVRTLCVSALAYCLLTFAFAALGVAVMFPERSKMMPSVMLGMLTSPGMVGQIVWFIAAYLVLHLAAAATWYATALPIGRRLGVAPERHTQVALLSFLPVLLWLLLANARLFPDSQFAMTVAPGIAAFGVNLLFGVLTVYLIVVLGAGLALWSVKAFHRAGARPVAALLGAVLVGAGGFQLLVAESDPRREQPDVILIGVDSLRPDHVGYYNAVEPSITPVLDGILAGAAVPEYAWTPLARTFPAWVSILTGRHIAAHGAHYNLVHRDTVDDSGSLAHRLAEYGYHRLYALDEVRFSNMDGSYGFDRTVTPAIGAFDFLAGLVGDLPLVNVVGNTSAGRVFFPFTHINRALSVSYHPETFDRRVRQAVASAPRHRPLFLVAHFELPHWPYGWAGSGTWEIDIPDALLDLGPAIYGRAVARADLQVGALMDALERAGRLENAIVVVLSDHGEAFIGHEPMWVPQSPTAAPVPRHAFHGSNVISEAQNRVVLAFRGYGPQEAVVNPRLIEDMPASLTDVSPTLHEWLAIDPAHEFGGASLMPALAGRDADELFKRAIPMETGFSLPSIAGGNPDAAEVIEAGFRYYDVDAAGRLSIRPDWVDYFRTQKQRAVVSGPWVLAARPVEHTGARATLTLAHLRDHVYWDAGEPVGLPAGAPFAELLAALCGYFGADPAFRLQECRPLR